jgi:hypothetical protein
VFDECEISQEVKDKLLEEIRKKVVYYGLKPHHKSETILQPAEIDK